MSPPLLLWVTPIEEDDMVRVKANPEPSPEDELVAKATQYIATKARLTELTKTADTLKKELSEVVSTTGEADEQGSLWYPLPRDIDGVVALKRERRSTATIDHEAVERVLAEHDLADRCFETRRVLNEDEVMACVAEGLLDDADLAAMFPPKITWAFVTSKTRR